ncbi:hypothetical protein [Acidipila sp. EB88]|uniref:hypothetical protein n=1 Tax=Acidipila sp. EB88 TaxID=2305226 RepID=UPI000F5DAA3C|nr:hypothetical protein [Acidipila sp. EB88]RRA48753.1 hypothetical protein D1Y84_11120 [Acidipila sp. EB88]
MSVSGISALQSLTSFGDSPAEALPRPTLTEQMRQMLTQGQSLQQIAANLGLPESQVVSNLGLGTSQDDSGTDTVSIGKLSVNA